MESQASRYIVQAGACWCPNDKWWRPCVRYEGEQYGSLMGPSFVSEQLASEWAQAYAKLKNQD